MSDVEDMQRGKLADAVLQNAVYQDGHDQIEQEIYRKWQDSRSKDDREELHRLLMALRLVRSALESTMRRGTLAAKELERRRKLSERIGDRFRRD